MNPLRIQNDHFVRRYDTLFEKMYVSVITLVITVTTCTQWYLHEDQLIEMFVQMEEDKANFKDKMEALRQLFIICSSLLVLKGYYRTADKRNGSARLHFNYYNNVALAILTVYGIVFVTDAINVEGFIGLLARTFYLVLALWYLAMLRMIQKSLDKYFSNEEFIQVGDTMRYRGGDQSPINGRFEVLDIHQRGIGGVIARDVNTGQIVDIPLPTALFSGSRVSRTASATDEY
ncbi:Thiol oxidoreductase [Corchorus olitorius]|uniref:Thiol oxidoreductase n=1 Tax=Corchorus olitorius TaxID=93759 RepID=A0A1R3J6A5_9ROSI|nr:Thiol oxidoreductase [Corchorus olitorius]